LVHAVLHVVAAFEKVDGLEALLEKLRLLEEERFVYYDDLRKKNAKWANGSRWLLALLGAIAFLLTGLVAALRFAPDLFRNGVWTDLTKGSCSPFWRSTLSWEQ
jgi:hypothetical protein